MKTRKYTRKMNWYQLYMIHSMVGVGVSKYKRLNEVIPIKDIKVLANSKNQAIIKLTKLGIGFGEGSVYSIKIIKQKKEG